MLDAETRTAIILLHREGHGIKAIARALNVSRNAVRWILRDAGSQMPPPERRQKAEAHLDLIRELIVRCKGNLVRVHEELEDGGVKIAYATLSRFCRRQELKQKPKKPAGRYEFGPGQEMQHDTSPHTVKVGERDRKLQCASLVLCFSRRLFAQAYPTFNRFWCKIFLTDAFKYFGAVADRCIVDNSSVVVAHGTGENAVMAPEMAAFAQRFDFHFKAHEAGDADRSGRVERPFHFIEHNFYPGRTFQDLSDLNRQFLIWCDKVNASFKSHIRAIPIELFAAERPHLKPLPIYIPDPCLINLRTVDLEGYVHLHTNRYSVPSELIDRQVEVRETKDKVRVYLGRKMMVEHERREDGAGVRVTLKEHRHPGRRGSSHGHAAPLEHEMVLRSAHPDLSALVEVLKKKHGGRAARAIRHLHGLFLDYPTEALARAAATAIHYGLDDLGRIERLVLRQVAGDFFRLPQDLIDDEEKNNE